MQTLKQLIVVDEPESVNAAAKIIGPNFDIAYFNEALDVSGRNVVYWPTARGPEIAKRAHLMAETAELIKTIATFDKPEGWNAARAIADGWTFKEFITWAKGKAIVVPKLSEIQLAEPEPAHTNGTEIIEDRRAPVSEELSEDALALQFTAQHGEDWRYVAAWGAWFNWTGARWQKETTLDVYDRIRMMCREEAELSELKENRRRKCYSAATISGVERLAHADRAHAMTVDAWDQDPWKLNTPAGIVDLKTGETSVHDREMYMTKITAGSIDKPSRPDRWLAFLNDVTAGDMELQAYLARVMGYALTGSTQEHALFFFYGTGANGKTVFLNTLASILDDYSGHLSTDTLLETHYSNHPTDIASLRGARAVIAGEVANGRRWDEPKLKALTGGDKISARFMRQDFFEFTPQFKLLIAGNHKPGLRDVDEAMRRRLHLIPFTVTIPVEKRDPDLTAKLLTEAPGILGWAIAGCLEWQAVGLNPPAVVLDATKDYFEAEDSFQRWINECCELSAAEATLTATLYESWKVWAERCGEYVVSIKRFSENMSAREFKKWRDPLTGRMGFSGIRVT